MISKEDVEKICLLERKWRPDNIEVEKVGGQTNRNYKIKYKNTLRFVRLP